mgnify:CR=1 FL=1
MYCLDGIRYDSTAALLLSRHYCNLVCHRKHNPHLPVGSSQHGNEPQSVVKTNLERHLRLSYKSYRHSYQPPAKKAQLEERVGNCIQRGLYVSLIK